MAFLCDCHNGNNFKTLTTIASKSRGVVSTDYNFFDAQVPSGWLYYRLKTVENSGKVDFSAVRTVFVDGEREKLFGVYPNPVGSRFSLQNMGRQEGVYQGRILDLMGRTVMVREVDFSVENRVDFEVSGWLVKGVYFLEVERGGVVVWKEKVAVQ